MSASACLLLASLAFQAASPGATPPPDRFDREHDRLLFELWGSYELRAGPFDPHLPPQAAPIRPTAWRVLGADPDSRQPLLDGVNAALDGLGDSVGRIERMPAAGALAGAFRAAATTVLVDRDQIRFVRAPGAEMVFVNGEGFAGDPARRGLLGVPVALREGSNAIVAVGIAAGFELELWQPMTRTVMALEAAHMPGSGGAAPDFWDVLLVPMFNASLEPAPELHFHFDKAVDPGVRPRLGEFCDGGFAAPLGMVFGHSYLFGRELPTGPEAIVPLAAFDGTGGVADRRLLALRMDARAPRWSGRDVVQWPSWTQGLLVVERSDEPELDAAALALARFTQERLWERGGKLVPLVTQDALATSIGQRERDQARWILSFGKLPDEGDGRERAWLGPESLLEPRRYAIRASSARAFGPVYAAEPCFHGVPAIGITWPLDELR